MTEAVFEEKLIEVLEDCAKSLRAQVKIMQDRNFLLEQTNAQSEKSYAAYAESQKRMTPEHFEPMIRGMLRELLIEYLEQVEKEKAN